MRHPPGLRPREEDCALALARLWLDEAATLAALRDEAQACLADARAQLSASATARLAGLAAAFEAVHLAALSPELPETARRIQALADQPELAHSPRAARLLQAAWALTHLHLPQTLPRSRSLLQAQGPAADDPRPVLERCWTDIALCAVHSSMGQHDAALASGAQALEMARACGHALLLAQAGQALVRCFLAAGDQAAAVGLAHDVMAALPRPGPPSLQAHTQHLLALVQAGRLTQAGQCLDQQAWLAEAALVPGRAQLRAAVALVRACQGRTDQALALLEPCEAAADAEGGGTTGAAPFVRDALLLALQADACRCLGLFERARRSLDEGLAMLQLQGLRPTGPQRAYLQRVLGQVCEALGDLPAALRALKQAQAAVHIWSAEGRHARQQVLQRLTPSRGALAQQPQFLALVVHELRNPLFGVQGMLSLMEGSGLTGEQQQHLGLAQRSAQLMLALCNDLLDLASIEAGRFDLQPEPVELASLLADTVQSLQPQAQARQLALSLQLPAGLPPRLLCDGRRLQQVLFNLLINALKFTDQGSVRLEARWQPEQAAPPTATPASGLLRLLVHDTGPGLSPQVQARLFAGPARFAVAGEPARAGAGLGLLICRQLLELMGGSIEHRNAHPVGSSFIVTLPLHGLAQGA